MPKAIDINQAKAMLRSREEMLQAGRSERELRRLVDAAVFVRVRRGWYVDAAEWNDLWNEGRHLLRVLAVAFNSNGVDPIFCGVSAAVLLGLPLYPGLAAAWHERMAAKAEAVSVRGIRQARDLLAFADGRAQLPGESVSRLHLRRLGFSDVDLQARVRGPGGEEYWMDFAFLRERVFGEFDGKAKYLDSDLNGARSVETVVLDEKKREDAVRGVTRWGVVRWGSEHILTANDLGLRLAAFGIRPS